MKGLGGLLEGDQFAVQISGTLAEDGDGSLFVVELVGCHVLFSFRFHGQRPVGCY